MNGNLRCAFVCKLCCAFDVRLRMNCWICWLVKKTDAFVEMFKTCFLIVVRFLKTLLFCGSDAASVE